jgi:hypothetical protein
MGSASLAVGAYDDGDDSPSHRINQLLAFLVIHANRVVRRNGSSTSQRRAAETSVRAVAFTSAPARRAATGPAARGEAG